MAAPPWRPRLATEKDIPAIQSLIPLSVRGLQKMHYSTAQMDLAIGPIFGADRQLIRDGTYYVIEFENQIIGCGGWSRRVSLSGSDINRKGEDEPLDPKKDPARIRAFFVHPDWARRGIARSIILECERAIIEAGFRSCMISATLTGELLYAAFGYKTVEYYDIPLDGGSKLPVVRMTKDFV